MGLFDFFSANPRKQQPTLHPPENREVFFENLVSTYLEEKKKDSAQLDPSKKCLIGQHPLCKELDTKTFCLMVGDGYIDRDMDNLQGALLFESMMDYMVSILTKNESLFKESGIDTEQLVKELAYSHEVARELEKTKQKSGTEFFKEMDLIGARVAESVYDLKVGSRLIIPAGYDAHEHLLCEITKTADKKYNFKIFNPGEKHLDQYHLAIGHGTKSKLASYIELENIDEVLICSGDFYKTLFQVLCGKGQNRLRVSKQEVYENILKQLKGTEKSVEGTLLEFRSPAKANTTHCWKVLLALLRSNCSSYGQYRKLKYIIWCQIYSDFYKSPKNADDKSVKYVLSSSAQKFSSSIYKSFNEGYLSQEELDSGLALIEKFQSQVKDNRSHSCEFITEVSDFSSFSHYPGVEVPSLQQIDETSCSFSSSAAKDPNEPKGSFSSIEGLENQIDSALEYATKLAQENPDNIVRANLFIKKKIMELPFPKAKEKDDWINISDEKKLELLEKMIGLQSFLFSCAFHIDQDALGVLCSHHLYAIMDKLARSSASSKLPKESSIFSRALFDLTVLESLLPTEELEDYKRKIFEYFQPEKADPRQDLFAFASQRKTTGNKFIDDKLAPRVVFDLSQFGYDPKINHYFVDYQYMYQLLKDSSVMESLEKEGCHTDKLRLKALLADVGDLGFLPKVDGQLKLAAILNECMNMNVFPIHRMKGFSKKFEMQSIKAEAKGPSPLEKWKSFEWNTSSQSRLYIAPKQWNLQNTTKNYIYFYSYQYAQSHLHTKSLLFSYRHVDSDLEFNNWGSQIGRILRYAEGVVYPSENEVIAKNSAELDFNASSEIKQQASLVEVNKDDAPFRLLSLIERYQLDLSQDDMQLFLIAYLYRSYTKKALKEKPLWLEKTKEVFLRAFDRCLLDKDVSTACFIIDYLNKAEGLDAEINGKKNETDFYRKEVLSKLQPLAQSPYAKIAVATTLALLDYPQVIRGNHKITVEQAVALYKAAILMARYHSADASSKIEVMYQSEIREMIFAYADELKNMLSAKEKQDLFLDLLSKELDLEPSGIWKGSFPLLSCDNYQINLLTGTISTVKDDIVFTKKVREDLRFLGIEEEHIQMSVDKEGWIKTRDGKRRVKPVDSYKKLLATDSVGIPCGYENYHEQLMINGEWFNIERSRFDFLFPNSICYIPEILEEGSEIVFVDQFEKEVGKATVKRNNQDPNKWEVDVFFKKIDGVTYRLVNPSEGIEGLQAIVKFEKSSKIWRNEAHEGIVEAGPYSFKFHEDTHQYESIQYPGYFLTKPSKDLLSGYEGCIRIMNARGESKLFVSVPEFLISHQLCSKVLTISLDAQGEPIASQTREAIVLFAIYFFEGNYKKASEFLKCAEEIGKYHDFDENVLRIISYSKGHHPDAVNCRMRALTMLLKDRLLCSVSNKGNVEVEEVSNTFDENIQHLYIHYLATKGKGSLPPIESYLEKILWAGVTNRGGFPAVLKDRYKELILSEYLPEVRNQDSLHQNFTPVEKMSSHLMIPFVILDRQPTIEDPNDVPFVGDEINFIAHFVTYFKEAQMDPPKDSLRRRAAFMKRSVNQDLSIKALAWSLELIMDGKIVVKGKLASTYDEYMKESEQSPGESNPAKTEKSRLFLQELSKEVSRFEEWKSLLDLSRTPEPFEVKNNSSGTVKKLKDHANKTLLEIEKKKAQEKKEPKNIDIFVLPLSLEKEKVLLEVPPNDQGKVVAISNRRKELEKEALDLEENILALANRLPKEPNLARVIQIKRLSGQEPLLTMKDLISMFIIGQNQVYRRATHLNNEEVNQLDHSIGECLKKMALAAHAENCLKDTSLLNEEPHYELGKERGLLVFEAMTGKRLQKNQVEKLKLLSDPKEAFAVLHMLMGEGKSTVITPIWALMKARGDNLPFVVVPESLHPEGKEVTKASVYNSFGRFGHAFKFDRSDVSAEKLKTLYELLQAWKSEKGFVYSTRENLWSFYLKCNELFFQYENSQNAKEKALLQDRVEYAWKIRKFIKESGVALFDEVHSQLNCKDELNFTVGRPAKVNKAQAHFIYEVLQMIVTDPLITQKLDLKGNNQAKMTEDEYEKVVKPKIVEYLSAKFGISADYFNEKVSSIPEAVSNHKQRDLIATGKALVSVYLPHTCKKKTGEHFGLGAHKSFSIPFLGINTPNEKAEFASYIETLLYTGYHYYQNGISANQAKELVEGLKKQARKDHDVSGMRVEETRAYKFFEKFTSKPLFNEFDWDALAVELSEHPEVVFAYLEDYIIPTVDIYTKRLSANAHSLVYMFKEVQGMTGTPWNKDSYAAHLKTHEESSIETKSLEVIRKLPPASFKTIPKGSSKELIDSIIKEFAADPKNKAIIDVGALFKGVSNESVAKMLLANTSISSCNDGVLFYDEKDELFVFEREKNRAIPFKESKIPKEKCVTYYDQRHSFGSDILQASDAKALVTISETTKKFELFQGIWRLRDLLKNQSIKLIVPEDVKKLMGETFDAASCLTFVSRIEEELVLYDNFRSRKLEIKVIVEDAVSKALMNAEDFDKRCKVFELAKDLLMVDRDKTAFEEFGQINCKEKAEKILGEYVSDYIRIIEQLADQKVISNKDEVINHIQSLRKIPLAEEYQRMVGTLDAQVENECEIEREVKREIKVEPVETTTQAYPWEEWKWNPKVDIFNDNWVKTSDVPKNSLIGRAVTWVISTTISAISTIISRIASFVYDYILKYLLPKSVDTKVRAIKRSVQELSVTTLKNLGNVTTIALDWLLLIPYRIKGYFTSQPHIYKASDVIESAENSKISKMKNIFDDNFLMSNNFMTRDLHRYRETRVEPFDDKNKPLYHLLVIQEGNNIKTMMIDQYDHQYFSRKLLEDANGGHKRKICIYDPVLGIVQEGKDRFDEKALKKHPSFAKHLMYAKFWGGITKYNSEEVDLLKSWIKKHGVYEMSELFNEILRYKPQSKKDFSDSVLFHVFKSIVEEESSNT